MTSTTTREQYYLFTMPGDMCPVWAETYLTDGTHVVAPTPFGTVEQAAAELAARHPGTTVDELDRDEDLAEVREWARTMPLEQIPA
jgi:hypothetical protein